MDLAYTDDEAAFAGEVRDWLASHLADAALPARFDSLDDEIEWGRRWQSTLAADRWVGIYWPSAYGGRSATPVEVALYNMEYARAGAPQPVNRVGINLAGPTLLAHGTEEQKTRWLPRILDASRDLVPAVQRARRRLATSPRCRRGPSRPTADGC